MTSRLTLITVTLCLILVAGIAAADNSGRIYGKVTTIDGDVFEGYIRWDKNEASWVDKLDGTKDLPDEPRKSSRKQYSERKNKIEIFGITIASSSEWDWSGSAQSGIRFGHIKTLENIGDNEALLTLKSGQEVELSGGSTDIGDDIREIIIEDNNEGEIEFVWDDIDSIEFMDAPSNGQSNFGDRLYGTLTTRRGEEFTGFVCWDIDELFTGDILDGSEKGRKRKIKFGKIESIERYSSNGATVIMKSGEDHLLRESNDVDDSNRGIIISDPNFGQVRVNWDEFEKLKFNNAPAPVRYGDFDGGKPLQGTVYTEDGDTYTGRIRWDQDEENSWEILDGEFHDIDFDIEFSKIKTIEKKSYRSSIVTLNDGRTFRLRGSNDIDEDNKGILIFTDNGEEVEVNWDDFDRVDFD